MRKLTDKDVKARIKAMLELNNSPAKIKLLEAYQGARIPLRMRCSVHGEFSRITLELYVKKNHLVCPSCSRLAVAQSRKDNGAATYQAELDVVHNGTIKLVGKYVCRKTKAWHLCTVCGHKANVVPHSKLQGHGCTVCTFVKRQSERGEDTHVNGTKHRVEGYEARALVYLVNATGLKSKELVAFSTGNVPSISYTHENKESGKGVYTHYYHPDFYAKKTNTLYEVKSTVTLGVFVPEVYRKNRSKAKGCVAQGYKHTLILVLRDGEVIEIENWHKKSRKSLIKYLHEDCMLPRLQ